MRSIDLNVDLGETDSPVPGSTELDLLRIVTSVNLSCGLHAGNPALLRHLLAAAAEHGIAVGAHPSYDDRPNFGRVETGLPAARIGPLVTAQIESLRHLAAETGARIRYVKAHGALYHRTAWDAEAAAPFADAVRAFDPDLWILAPAASPLAAACAERGIPFAAEAFLDRGYQADAHLVPRGRPGDLIHDPHSAGARAVALARSEPITTDTGTPLTLSADSLCAHGDSGSALPVLRSARAALAAAGIALRAFAR